MPKFITIKFALNIMFLGKVAVTLEHSLLASSNGENVVINAKPRGGGELNFRGEQSV